jgi:hypothetical protein
MFTSSFLLFSYTIKNDSFKLKIRPKHVENLKIDYPSSSSRSARVGQIERKHVKYDVWSLAEASPGDDNDVDDDMIGGEELKRLVCLLPRKRKDGKLYLGE